jgi:hypothetical protein
MIDLMPPNLLAMTAAAVKGGPRISGYVAGMIAWEVLEGVVTAGVATAIAAPKWGAKLTRVAFKLEAFARINKMEGLVEAAKTIRKAAKPFLSAELAAEANHVLGNVGSNLHPRIRKWAKGEAAEGIFRYDGIDVPLQSGKSGPGKYLSGLSRGEGSGLNAQIPTHVEGHAAGLMHEYGITVADVFVNKPPCATGAMCRHNLHKVLPPGGKLTITFLEDDGITVTKWLFEHGIPGWKVL